MDETYKYVTANENVLQYKMEMWHVQRQRGIAISVLPKLHICELHLYRRVTYIL